MVEIIRWKRARNDKYIYKQEVPGSYTHLGHFAGRPTPPFQMGTYLGLLRYKDDSCKFWFNSSNIFSRSHKYIIMVPGVLWSVLGQLPPPEIYPLTLHLTLTLILGGSCPGELIVQGVVVLIRLWSCPLCPLPYWYAI